MTESLIARSHDLRWRSLALGALVLAMVATATLTGGEADAQDAGPVVEVERIISSAYGRGGTSTDSQAISPDGRFVVFAAGDGVFTERDEPSIHRQMFLTDRTTGAVEQLTVAPDGASGDQQASPINGAGISDDGQVVAFASVARNLVPVESDLDQAGDGSNAYKIFLRDRSTGQTRLVSRRSDGVVVAGFEPTISGDGTRVAFTTVADLTADADACAAGSTDSNGTRDTYVYDVTADCFLLGSTRSDGAAAGTTTSGDGRLSRDGGTVVFGSDATDVLDGGATTAFTNILAMDLETGTVELVSETADGTEQDGFVGNPRVSADGNRVAFTEIGRFDSVDGRLVNLLDPSGDVSQDLLVKDRTTGAVSVVTVAPGDPTDPGYVDAEGPETWMEDRYGFAGDGTRLVFAADDADWGTTYRNIFVHDVAAGRTAALHAPEPNGPSSNPLLSADGLTVAFDSRATDLAFPDIAGAETPMASVLSSLTLPPTSVTTERLVNALSDPIDGGVDGVATSPDGRFVAFISDATDLLEDRVLNQGTVTHQAYLLDRSTGEVELLTVDASGEPITNGEVDRLGGIDLTPDGRYVVFSHSGGLDPAVPPSTGPTSGHAVFVRDRVSAAIQQVSIIDGQGVLGRDVSISEDGRYIAYATTDPVSGADSNASLDVVVRDRQEDANLIASVHTDGTLGDAPSLSPQLSGDGTAVVFHSFASNLVNATVSARSNVFVHELPTETTTATTSLVSAMVDGTPSDGESTFPAVSRDGRQVAFIEEGDGGPHNLDAEDDRAPDVVVKDLDTGALEVVSIAPADDAEADVVGQPSITPDGRAVTFVAEGPGSWDAAFREGLYLRDRVAGTTVRLNRSDGFAFPVSLQAVVGDGRSAYFANSQLYEARLVDGVGPTWADTATLTASSTGQTVTTLSWDAATDDVGVTNYRLLQDGAPVDEVDGATRSTTVTGLEPETTYDFTVVAVDAAGNTTPGPSTNVTTLAGDGAARLVADAEPGGIVTLTWDPTSSDLGYRILRDDGGGFATVADVGSGVTSYRDSDLPAATTLTYRIDLLDGTTASPHTDPVAVTTPALQLDEVTWDGPRNRALRLLLGSSIELEAVGEPNRDVTATVTVLRWDLGAGLLDEPASVDVEVALTADPADPGRYLGTFALEEGTAQVAAVAATMTDGAGSDVSVTSDASPVDVTGRLSVTLDISGGEVTDGALVALHPTIYGARVPVTGGIGPFDLEAVTPAAGYTLRLLAPDGRDLALDAPPVDVPRGRTVEQELIVSLPATLTVDVTSSEGSPSGTIEILDAVTDDVLGQDTVRGGLAGPFDDLVSGREVQVRFEPSGASLHDAAELTTGPLPLTAGDNLFAAAVPRPPLGTLSGTVVEEDSGQPVADASVSFTFDYLERWQQLTATTDAAGRFRLEAPAAVGELTVRPGAAPRVVRSDVEIVAGSTTELEIRTPPTRAIEVEVDLFTQLPGGELVQAPMYRQQAVHFHVTTTIDGRVQGGGSYPMRRVVGLDATSVLVCADGWEVGLPAACDTALIGDDGVARGRIELVWPGAVVATLHGADGLPIPDDLAWSAVVREPVADGHRILDRHAGTGPEMTLPLREYGSYSIDVVTDTGERRILAVTATSGTPSAELGILDLTAPGPFATFIGETEKNLDQPGSDVGIVNLIPGPDGWMDVRVELDNTGAAVTDAVLRLEHPSGAEPRANGATVDGGAVQAVVGDRTLDVPLGDVDAGDRRTVRVRLPITDPVDARLLGVRAFLVTASGTEFVGRDDRPLEPITLMAPATVRTPTFTVGGRTRPGGTVQVADDLGDPLGTAVADANGRWRTSITLPDRGPWFRHRVSAELEGAGGVVTDPVAIEIDETFPEIASVTMSQFDREVDIELGDDPFVFPFTFNPTLRLGFEVEFVDPEQVRDPVVAVGRSAAPLLRRDDGVFVASMAQWSSGLGPIWVTNDHAVGPALFDRPAPTLPEITSWTPSLEQAEIGDPVFGPEPTTPALGTGGDDLLAQQVGAALAPPGTSAGATPVQTASTTASWTDQPHAIGGGGTYDVDIEVTTLDDYVISAADAAREAYSGLPIYSPSVSGGVTATTVRGSAFFRVPLDAITDAAGTVDPVALRTMVVAVLDDEAVLRDDGTVLTGPRSPLVLANAGAAVRVAEVSLEVFLKVEDTRGALGIPDVADQIAAERARAYACDGPAGPGLQRAADALRARFFGAEAVKFGLGIASGGLAATGVGAVPAAGLAVISYAMGSFIDDETAGLIEDVGSRIDAAYAQGDCDDDGDGDGDGSDDDGSSSDYLPVSEWQPTTPEGHHGKCILLAETLAQLALCDDDAPEPIAEPVWVHDPSGYVYEAVPENRLPGVTATVFHAPTSLGPWTAWDAEWFGQENPQTTDADGRYGWDVPEGWWKVRYEADGFLTGESEVLEVLPPHFDVNVGLLDPSPPSLEAVRVTSDGTAIDVVFDRHMQADDLDATGVRLLDGDRLGVEVGRTFPDGATDPDGRSLATTVRLAPTSGLEAGATYTVDVGSLVRSYAGTPLTGDVEQQVTVAPNAAPQAADDTYAMHEDQQLAVAVHAGVLANDTDADGHALVAVLEEPPSSGRLALAADGSFVYDPVEDFAGAVTFTYRATDGADVSDAVTVRLVIAAVDDAPRPVDDAYTTTAEEPVTETAPGVLANDSDDGDRQVALLTAEPNTGTVQFTGDGGFTYVPAAGFVGTDGFAYRVWDGGSLSEAAWVSVEVSALPSGPPDPPRFPQGDDGLPDWVRCPQVPAADFPHMRPDAAHADAVGCFAALELVRGFADGTFRPAEPITRAQFATVLDRILAASGFVLPDAPFPFDDVDGVHTDAIARLAAADIIRGRSTTRFAPEAPVTRGQVASLLQRTSDALGRAFPDAGPAFSDTAASEHGEAIARARAAGIASGYLDGTFGPGEAVQRDQATSLFARWLLWNSEVP